MKAKLSNKIKIQTKDLIRLIIFFIILISPMLFSFLTSDILHLRHPVDALYLYVFVIWPAFLAFVLYK